MGRYPIPCYGLLTVTDGYRLLSFDSKPRKAVLHWRRCCCSWLLQSANSVYNLCLVAMHMVSNFQATQFWQHTTSQSLAWSKSEGKWARSEAHNNETALVAHNRQASSLMPGACCRTIIARNTACGNERYIQYIYSTIALQGTNPLGTRANVRSSITSRTFACGFLPRICTLFIIMK
jgi:hypothetical protein